MERRASLTRTPSPPMRGRVGWGGGWRAAGKGYGGPAGRSPVQVKEPTGYEEQKGGREMREAGEGEGSDAERAEDE